MYLVIDLDPPSSRALIFVAWVRHKQVVLPMLCTYSCRYVRARYAVLRPYIADIAICVRSDEWVGNV